MSSSLPIVGKSYFYPKLALLLGEYRAHNTQYTDIQPNNTQHKGLICDNQRHSGWMTLSITMLCHYSRCYYAECHVLFIIILNIVMLRVVMLSVIMLTVVAPGLIAFTVLMLFLSWLVIAEVTLFFDEASTELAVGLTLTIMLVMYTMYQSINESLTRWHMLLNPLRP